MLRALIHQFISKKNNLFSSIDQKGEVIQSHSLSDNSREWSFEVLWKIFSTLLLSSAYATVYCFIDVLDECDPRATKQFLSRSSEVFEPESYNNSPVKIFLSSHESKHISESLYSLPKVQKGAIAPAPPQPV
jgi:hypothetical protein